jgi:hypothetical protein
MAKETQKQLKINKKMIFQKKRTREISEKKKKSENIPGQTAAEQAQHTQ